MIRKQADPLLGEFVNLDAMRSAADAERVPAPVRLAGDLAGSATPEQVRVERLRRDVVDRLRMPSDDRGAAA